VSPRRDARGDRKINLNASAPKKKAAEQQAPIVVVPLKPQRKLFAGLLVVFAAWVGILLTLYFTTIYPRHLPGDIRPPEATQPE